MTKWTPLFSVGDPHAFAEASHHMLGNPEQAAVMAANKTRVCMIAYKCPPLHSGAGTQALRLAKKLRERGTPIFMLTANRTRAEREGFIEGVKVYWLPAFGPKRIKPLTFVLAASLFLLRNRSTYDIVHLHGAYWRIAPIILIAKLLRKKIIVKMTSLGTDDPVTIRRRLFGSILLSTVAMADAVVAITDGLTNSYIQAGLPLARLARIPNGVDTKVFKPVGSKTRRTLRITFGIPLTAPVVLFVGAVRWLKGVDLLLTAWQTVQKRFPEAILILVGPISTSSGPYGRPFAEYIDDYISSHLSPQNIRILGQQVDVQRFYQMADVFVLPSRLEGLPNALLEAMACGLPCVGSDIPSIHGIITNKKNGLIFESENTEQLADAISSLLSNEQKARELGQRAREAVMTRYSLESVTEAYLHLYDRLSDRCQGKKREDIS